MIAFSGNRWLVSGGTRSGGGSTPYLFASTFLALGSNSRPNCSLCLESDHSEEDCTLAKGNGPPGPRHRGLREPQQYREREGHQRSNKGRSGRPLVCFAWNQGECNFHSCKFEHAYARCGGDHRFCTGGPSVEGQIT